MPLEPCPPCSVALRTGVLIPVRSSAFSQSGAHRGASWTTTSVLIRVMGAWPQVLCFAPEIPARLQSPFNLPQNSRGQEAQLTTGLSFPPLIFFLCAEFGGARAGCLGPASRPGSLTLCSPQHGPKLGSHGRGWGQLREPSQGHVGKRSGQASKGAGPVPQSSQHSPWPAPQVHPTWLC